MPVADWRLVTLAPERDPGLKVTRWLAGQAILVSAGHCDASTDQLRAAIDAGLSMFTHLGNGCPTTLHRHDNIIQRVLSLRKRLTISFIADGVHVPAAALGNYLRLAGVDRSIVVTDAITAARARSQALHLRRAEGRRRRRPGRPVGRWFALCRSTTTMPRMAACCVSSCNCRITIFTTFYRVLPAVCWDAKTKEHFMSTGFGIIGCGMIASFHARAIAELRGAKLVACFDAVPAAADRLASPPAASPITI